MKTYIVEWTATDGSKHTEEWDLGRIRRAFKFGEGTEADFLRFITLNKGTMSVIATQE